MPTLTLTRVDRTTVQLSWTPTGAGAQYDLQRRKVVSLTNADGTAVLSDVDDGSEASFTRLPSSLLTTTSYTDSAANFVAPADTADNTHSVEYRYRVQAQDSNGVTGDWSKVKSLAIPRAGAVLSSPAGLRASPISDSDIRVSWANVEGAEFYELQWKSGDRSYSTAIRVNRPDSGSPFYDHTNLSPATRYTYQVRGVDINGAGAWSSARSAATRSTAAAAGQMPKVRGLTVTDDTSNNDAAPRTAKLTWTAVSDATHYQIQRFDPAPPVEEMPEWADLADNADNGDLLDDNGRITVANAGSPPTYDDGIDAAAAGKTYFYVVSAIDDRGKTAAVEGANDLADDLGEWSDHKSVTFKDHKPAVPTELTATQTTGTSIWVSWTKPDVSADADSLAGAATSYMLQWRIDGTKTWRNIPVTGRTTHHHTGLRGNTSYNYQVRAENSGGESDYVSSFPLEVILGNTLTPPTGVKAEDATTGATTNAPSYAIKVSWNAVTGADSYEIQRFGAGNESNEWGDLGGMTELATAEPGTSVTNEEVGNGLAASTTYLYRVRTVKEEATSGWSLTASGTTDAVTPDPPMLVAISTGVSMIRLSWEAVPGATSYELEFSEGAYGTASFEDDNFRKSKITISGNFRNYVHTGRKAGTRYTYRLSAALPQGNTAWPETPVMQYTKPAKPDLTATAADATSMTLTWGSVPFVSDSDTLTVPGRLTLPANYEVERRVSGGSGDWTSVDTSSAVCGAANKCTLTDSAALTAGTLYFYRIRAMVMRPAVMPDATATYTSYWDYASQKTPAATVDD